jgi:hypothetical protein
MTRATRHPGVVDSVLVRPADSCSSCTTVAAVSERVEQLMPYRIYGSSDDVSTSIVGRQSFRSWYDSIVPTSRYCHASVRR